MKKIKLNKYYFIYFIALAFFCLSIPVSVFALTNPAAPVKQTFLLNVPIGNLTGFTIDANAAASGNNILGDYIKVWYGFLLGTIGILATVMIMWGGFKYLTSRGDKGMIDGAKTNIISAITGVVLAFGTYTLLSLVNPALLTINMPNLPGIQGGDNVKLDPGSGGTKVNQNSPSDPKYIAGRPEAITQAYDNKTAINYENMDIPAINPGTDLSQYDEYFKKYGEANGIDPNLLKAICAAESGGDPNSTSAAGAYGLMQFLPSTASTLSGTNLTGEDLKNNPELSINLAAQYLARNPQANMYDLIAGYNGGYDNTAGSGHALSPSTDCSGALAYQCTTNPGGLVETQNYVYKVTSFYNFFRQ